MKKEIANVKYGSFGQVYIFDSSCEKKMNLMMTSSRIFQHSLSANILREIFILQRNCSNVKDYVLLHLDWFIFDTIPREFEKVSDPKVSIWMPKLNQDLMDWIQIATPKQRLCSFPKLCCQILFSLFLLHQRGITHRDVKSANVLLKGNPISPDFVLCDFGCSCQQSKNEGKNYDDYPGVGTPWFMSPEMLDITFYNFPATTHPSFASDIWSFGIMLLELLMGYSFEDLRLWYEDHKTSHLHPFRDATALYCPHPTTLHWRLKHTHWFADLWQKILGFYKKEKLQRKFIFPHDPSGQLAFEFLQSILTSSYETRPTAWSLLQHPFIQTSITLKFLFKQLLNSHEQAFLPDFAKLKSLANIVFDKEAISPMWKSKDIGPLLTSYAASLSMVNINAIIPFGPHCWKNGTVFRKDVYSFIERAMFDLFGLNQCISEEIVFAIGDYLDYFFCYYQPLHFASQLFDHKHNYFWTATVVIWIVCQWFMKPESISITQLLVSFGRHLIETNESPKELDSKEWKRIMSNHEIRVYFFQAIADIIEHTNGKMVLSRQNLFPYIGLQAQNELYYSKTTCKQAFQLFHEYFLSIKL